MRNGHIIYQDIAEPFKVAVASETITVDKWYRVTDNPVLRKTLSAAVLAGAFFFVNSESLVAGTKVPEWHPQANQPRSLVSNRTRQHTGEFRFELPRTILVTDWFQPTHVPYFTKRRNYFTGESRFELPRTILVSDWFRPASEPFFSKRRNYFTGEFKFELPRTILVTDWLSQLPIIVKQIRREFGGETRIDIIQSPVTIDQWYSPASEPYKKYRILISGGEFRTEVVSGSEIVTVDKWYQPTQQPRRIARLDQLVRFDAPVMLIFDGEIINGNSKISLTLDGDSLITYVLDGKGLITYVLDKKSKIK